MRAEIESEHGTQPQVSSRVVSSSVRNGNEPVPPLDDDQAEWARQEQQVSASVLFTCCAQGIDFWLYYGKR